MEIDRIKEYLKLMDENNLKIFSVVDGDTEVYLETHSDTPVPVQYQPVATSTDEESGADSTKKESDLIEVRSTQIGTFYSQPDEDSTDTFVSVGDKVNTGDQIGLIEIMKLFNEVRVEQSGVIEKILVANGEPVEYDQVLMLLKAEEE